MIKYCKGCGIKLQTENKELLGYIPKEKYDNSKLCVRCFRLKNYGDLKTVYLPKDNKAILKVVNNKSELSFFLIDFLNINHETIDTFKSINTNKILIVSKLDIIPKGIKKEKITNWLKEEYQIEEEIIYLSALTNYGITSIINSMDKKRIKTAYLLGYTNAGKSTLINKINQKYNGKEATVTTSLLPNTTLDFVRIAVNELVLMDSPGFIMKQNLYNNDEIDLINRIASKGIIKPITYQIKPEMSVILENKIRIESLSLNSWTFYLSNALELNKVYDKNQSLKELELKTIEVKDNHDIVIKGIGFINIKSACQIKIYTNLHDLIEIRKSIF